MTRRLAILGLLLLLAVPAVAQQAYEIFNLRAIARGKEVNLPIDRMRGYLVM